MKVYEAVYKEEEMQGVYALSVVENPAMQDMWITLSEHPEQIELAEVDKDKRLLLGAALIPNKRITRNIKGNIFEVFFTAQTIEKVAHDFMKKQNNNNSSLGHDVKLEDMSVVESWIVEDPDKDKSNQYGKRYEKGTWVAMMKVDNNDIWGKAKRGEIKGFSIDALLGLKEFKLNTNIEMSTETSKSIVDAIKDGFNALLNKEEVKPEVETAPETTNEVVEEVVEEKVDMQPLIDALTEQLTQLSSHFDSKLETVKAEFATQKEDLKKENEELKVELSKQPEVDKVKLNPEKVELSDRPKDMLDWLNANCK